MNRIFYRDWDGELIHYVFLYRTAWEAHFRILTGRNAGGGHQCKIHELHKYIEL